VSCREFKQKVVAPATIASSALRKRLERLDQEINAADEIADAIRANRVRMEQALTMEDELGLATAIGNDLLRVHRDLVLAYCQVMGGELGRAARVVQMQQKKTRYNVDGSMDIEETKGQIATLLSGMTEDELARYERAIGDSPAGGA
jgi:hypothetical protein